MIQKFKVGHPWGTTMILAQKIAYCLQHLDCEVKLVTHHGIIKPENAMDIVALEIGFGEKFIVSAVGAEEKKAFSWLASIFEEHGITPEQTGPLDQMMPRTDRSDTIIIYGSSSGNTKRLALVVWDELVRHAGHITFCNVKDVDAQNLDDFKTIIFGIPTYEGGSLQVDFEPFYEQLDRMSLEGKTCGVFGPGAQTYDKHFCEAVDTIQEKIKARKAQIAVPPLKIDGEITFENIRRARVWAREGFLHGGVHAQ